MKSPTGFIFALLIITGCVSPNAQIASSGDRSVYENIARLKKSDPKHFAFSYGWIDLSDGANAEEALAIAKLYFDSWRLFDGAVIEQKRVGGSWRFRAGVGYGGTRIRPIWVNAKTGSVWQEGGEKIDQLADLLQPEPNQ